MKDRHTRTHPYLCTYYNNDSYLVDLAFQLRKIISNFVSFHFIWICDYCLPLWSIEQEISTKKIIKAAQYTICTTMKKGVADRDCEDVSKQQIIARDLYM